MRSLALPRSVRRWVAIGTGVGIEIRGADLHVTVARVRPQGVRIMGTALIPRFRERPAADWGDECRRFLVKAGARLLSATVLLPREEVTVRVVALPGVADKDLTAALALQLDTLHPYPEDDIAYDATRLNGTGAVLVATARRSVVESYAALFAEAGLKTASFTVSAAVIHCALRLFQEPPTEFLAVTPRAGDGVEVYGESPSRPVFSAVFDRAVPQAIGRAVAELRLPPDAAPVPLPDLLPKPVAAPAEVDPIASSLPYATALASACPWLGLSLNLLPAEQRRTSNRLVYVPTAALATVLLLMLGAVVAQSGYEDGRYRELVQRERTKVRPQAIRVAGVEQEIERARARLELLERVRGRSRNDMDLLNELTRLLPPPNWTSALDLNRRTVNVTGEAEQAAELLKVLDSSPFFQGSEYVTPLTRVNNAELFRIRTQRERGGE